jgi:hypothetical protein
LIAFAKRDAAQLRRDEARAVAGAVAGAAAPRGSAGRG